MVSSNFGSVSIEEPSSVLLFQTVSNQFTDLCRFAHVVEMILLFMQVFVKMIDLETDHEYNWTREKFFNRKYVMQEMFENYTEGDEWQLPPVCILQIATGPPPQKKNSQWNVIVVIVPFTCRRGIPSWRTQTLK